MPGSPLLGRRIHLAGSVVDDLAIASAKDVTQAREMVTLLVQELVARGANFVVPVDAEPVRKSDGLPICFDWLVWKAIKDNLALRPSDAPGPLAIAILHHKTEDQIPPEYAELWDDLRASSLVQIESAASWNMNSKRMEAQARAGDILVPLGGTEGVLFLANLYHDAGKPIVPLNLPLTPPATGARRLYDFGLASGQTRRLFQIANGGDAHHWLNKIRFPARQETSSRVSNLIGLLEGLERPSAFVIRLLNDKHPDYKDVQAYFEAVVRPVIEDELGYRMTVVDGQQPHEHARLDQEIFAKLHRSRVVLADVTGARPNCFIELGYALGRSLPTMVLARDGSDIPFDITTVAGLRWKVGGSLDERKLAFRQHWTAIRNRPALVPAEPLIS